MVEFVHEDANNQRVEAINRGATPGKANVQGARVCGVDWF